MNIFRTLIRLFCIIHYSLFIINCSLAQSRTIDSLKKVLLTAKHDTVKLRLLVELSEICDDKDILHYSTAAVKLADQLLANPNLKLQTSNFKLKKALALNNIGYIYQQQGQIKEALDYFGRSLKIQKEINDKQGIANSFTNIGYVYQLQGQNKEALDYFGRSLKLREEINDKQGIAGSLNNIGYIYLQLGQIKEALNYHSRSLKIREAINDKSGIANSLNNLGYIYHQQGQIKEALNYYSRSLKIQEEVNDKHGMGYSLNNIAYIYQQQGQIKEALEYYSRSLKIREEINDKRGIAESLNNIGFIYQQMADELRRKGGNPDSVARQIKEALNCCSRSLKIREEINDKFGMGYSLNSIGLVYQQMADELRRKGGSPDSVGKQIKVALDYFARSLKIREEIDDKCRVAITLINIGSIYFLEKKYTEAGEKGALALQTAAQTNEVEQMRNAQRLLSQVDSAKGNFKSALEHYKQYIVYRDSISNTENQKKAVQQQMNYEFEKKMAEQKAEQEKKDAVQKAEARRQKIVFILTSGFLILVLVFAGFIARAYLQIKKKNKEIALQKQKIEEKQNEILASIRYAKRIQDALLPRESYIDKTLNRLKAKMPARSAGRPK